MSMSNTEKTVKGIHRNTRRKFSTEERKVGLDGLENQGRASRRHWNRIPGSVRRLVVEMALDRSDLTPRTVHSLTNPAAIMEAIAIKQR